jgi:beta-N-acetylhexosaminidase
MAPITIPPEELKIGRLLVFGFHGRTIPDYIKRLIHGGNLGGVILFSDNGGSIDDFKELIAGLKTGSPRDPLIFIDQEGGRVLRIPLADELCRSAEELSELNDPKTFAEITRRTAAELKDIGIDVNTVPVVDIPESDDVPVLKGRCYGHTPEMVIEYSSLLIDIYRARNILCCAKHFPGLGDTVIDPHHELPVDSAERSRYYDYRFLPFVNAIELGVPLIMTTHLVAGAIDDSVPATFSRKVVKETLCDELRFGGLVVSDDLEMGAVARNYSQDEIIIRTLRAGHHLMLICRDKGRQLDAMDILENKIKIDDDLRLSAARAIDKVEKFKIGYFESR